MHSDGSTRNQGRLADAPCPEAPRQRRALHPQRRLQKTGARQVRAPGSAGCISCTSERLGAGAVEASDLVVQILLHLPARPPQPSAVGNGEDSRLLRQTLSGEGVQLPRENLGVRGCRRLASLSPSPTHSILSRLPAARASFALLWPRAFPAITLLQKSQTSGRSPGRTCGTASSGPCLDRESLHPILFLNGLASVQISGFCFVAVQGGLPLLERTPLTGRSITSSS
ncbi:uncharacterized protein LJ206_019370 isoform 1-T1 [Theristicus caerulescens]